MRYKQLVGFGCSLAIVFGGVTAANAFPFVGEIDDARELNPTGKSFTQQLAKDYRKFTLFEADDMYDWIDAEYFAKKALAANQGKVLAPEKPGAWNIDAEHMPELTAARASLVAALDQGGRILTPHYAARAQVMYDCWVEQQEEGHQPAHIASCRGQFRSALALLERELAAERAKTTKKASAADPDPSTALSFRAVEVSKPEATSMSVYFDWDKADVDASELNKLEALVTTIRPLDSITLSLEGHADKSGPSDYNMTLSRQRAENVRKVLERLGARSVDVTDIAVVARGEDDPAVETPDGVRNAANRRVEITAQGTATKTVSVMSNESK